MGHPIIPRSIPPLATRCVYDVAVVGSGVIGLSAALWLQKAGHRVTLVDPSPPTSGNGYLQASSFGNACTIAMGACIPVASPDTIRGVPKMLLNRQSPLSIYWGDLVRLLPWVFSFLKSATLDEVSRIVGVLGELLRLAEAGHAPLFRDAGAEHLKRKNGCLYLYSSEASFNAAFGEIEMRRREGVQMRILDREEIKSREPNLAPLYHKGLLFLDAYNIDDPLIYAQLLLRLFIARGGRVLEKPVISIECAESDLEVRCEDQSLRADRVVVAAGAWSRKIALTVGDRIRLDTERGYHVQFPGSGHLLSAPTCYPEHGFYMTPLAEGMRSAGTVELGGLDAAPREARFETIERVTRQLLPDVGASERKWLGFRPSMPDSLPVISPSPTDRRVIYAFGHGHIGLTLGGITGRLVADIIGEQPSLTDLHPLRADRF